ncbi:type II toxin-antitoxin system RelE/ParE family toxin [Hyella patelloides]|uniref:type II toxin-antitoxin system RelE/ParE family toxin n=1 Tax=Hyella patelloides TaxID=1982969 RepID=UPI001FE89922|nr:type II toxin-antitoxin system RelE/ParE family toxin [Hyella patelloides]
MIKTFACKETKKIWNGQRSSKLPGDIQNRALKKLRQLDAALTLEDLRNPPGNRLEALKGDKPTAWLRYAKDNTALEFNSSGEFVLPGTKAVPQM